MTRGIAQPQNLIFWGAGATKALGISATAEQQQFIRSITGADDPARPLEERVSEALSRNNSGPWRAALFDLITILGDGDAAYESISAVDDKQIETMRRNWREGADPEELCRRIIDLRLIYDWPALKSAVRLCPGSKTHGFRLNDLFNLLDMHIPLGSGFRGPVPDAYAGPGGQRQQQFFDVRRLTGAKNALLMILIALFYIDYQVCIDSKREDLRKYYDFARLLGQRMQRQGLDLARSGQLDQPAFYQGDVGFVSMNYDPIALWVGFIANRDLNLSHSVPHIGSPAVPLHMFHDMGHLIPARKIGRSVQGPWYPMNEAAAQRINKMRSGGDRRVRLTKFLFPHGCLCWRECPDCGKLSAYHGDQWELCDHRLFPPPPLRAFDQRPLPDWIADAERDQREKGKVDARECLHCGALTFAHHTQAVMQSSFKPRPPSFIEEIERDLRATTMQAGHIIFMGYSLPLDDVIYRAFLSARKQRGGAARVLCTVVDKDAENPGWYGPAELKRRIANGSLKEYSPARAACDIFGENQVRLYGGGVPDVFLDRGEATDAKLDQLLTWSP